MALKPIDIRKKIGLGIILGALCQFLHITNQAIVVRQFLAIGKEIVQCSVSSPLLRPVEFTSLFVDAFLCDITNSYYFDSFVTFGSVVGSNFWLIVKYLLFLLEIDAKSLNIKVSNLKRPQKYVVCTKTNVRKCKHGQTA